MKNSHPVETAEFPRASEIDDEAAFAWWYRSRCGNLTTFYVDWSLFGESWKGCANSSGTILCGKTARCDYRQHLRSYMWHLGFKFCPADPDVWMQQPALKDDGIEYYENILLYKDDILLVGANAEKVIRNKIGKYSGWTASNLPWIQC